MFSTIYEWDTFQDNLKLKALMQLINALLLCFILFYHCCKVFHKWEQYHRLTEGKKRRVSVCSAAWWKMQSLHFGSVFLETTYFLKAAVLVVSNCLWNDLKHFGEQWMYTSLLLNICMICSKNNCCITYSQCIMYQVFFPSILTAVTWL